MRLDDMELVRALPLLNGMTGDNLPVLLQGAFLQRFPIHVDLIREGEPADFLHVIVEGQVELFARYRDRETTITVLSPPSCFILAAVMLERPYLKSARVLSPSRILLIPADNVRSMFADDPVFARAIAHELSFAFRGVVKELKNQKLRGTIERLAAWLVRYHSESGTDNQIVLPFDKKVLASRLGMVPEVLSRTFVNLKDYGVKVDGPRIIINDLAALQKLAAPDDLIDNPES
ncbi:MAG: cyclic nucleotide-binding domain-containing protein [Beijerinckiaceae bacterium]